MEYRRFGHTGLHVSSIGLGTMQFGWTADEPTAFAVLDAFVDAGGTLIDTADIYSYWHPNNPGGVAEQIIGRWMQQRGNRRDVIIATKVRGRMWNGPSGEGLSRSHIITAIDESLRRLQTEYIDLYQAHWFDSDTPIEETMAAFDTLVQSGKVRYLGCSNYPAWRLARALWVSNINGWARYESLQPHYNLVYRAEFERENEPLCLDQGIAVLPYSPLAGGFLTGKYRPDQPPPTSSRAERAQALLQNPQALGTLSALDEIAQERGVELPVVALAWLLTRPSVTAPIIGANSPEQLRQALPAATLRLRPDEVERLNQASTWSNE